MASAPSRYELLDRIAVGGMAEVFRAKAFGAHGFEKTLAIKKILPELANDPEFEDRFIAEAKLAVGLSHANVVQVLDFGRFAGTLFIAMELVQGLDLAALLRFYRSNEERISIPAAFQIAIELARGLSFAHQNGVVHRDVSPSNILLSKAGEVKIADFGIAMAMVDDEARDRGRIMGKWRYMSPEQTQGGELTASSDLFSAAIVIWEIFAGQKLFSGNNSEEITESIRSKDIPLLSELRPGVPSDLDEILGKALQRDQDKRTLAGPDMIRALTEASYRSSLVATSVDVAEAVEAAAEAGVEGASVKPGQDEGLDALIRAQLAAGNQFADVARKTSVDVAHAETEIQQGPQQDEGRTMVPSGVDGRGVTLWRLDAETVAAGPMALRSGVEGQALPSLENEGAEFERYRGLRKGIVLSLLGFLSFAGLLFFMIGKSPNRQAKSGVLKLDAAVAVPMVQEQILHLSSEPAGATIQVNGTALEALSPTDISVAADSDIQLVFVLDGYEPYAQEVRLRKGENMTLSPNLRRKSGTLWVQSTPPGATLRIDGKEVGVTPFVSNSFPPGRELALELRLDNYHAIKKTVQLGDSPLVVEEVMRSSLVYGRVNISIIGEAGPDGVPRAAWARVYQGKKALGDAPREFSLPVGKHSLVLKNPESGKVKRMNVEVFANKVATYTVRF